MQFSNTKPLQNKSLAVRTARCPIALVIGFHLLADFAAGQQNILKNGSFEAGMMCYSGSVWSLTSQDFKGDYKFLLSSDSPSGGKSIEVRCAGPDCAKASIVSDKIATPPGQRYKLSVSNKCPAGRLADVYVPGTQGGGTFQPLTCNGSWSTSQITFTVGTSDTEFNFYITNRDVEWLRVDDVVLTYVDGTVPQTPVLYPGVRNVRTSGQTLLVDDTPYLALGFFDVPYDDLPQAAATGANTINAIGPSASANCFNTYRETYLDRAYELGLNFVPNSSWTARLASPVVFSTVIPAFAPHKANILWFLTDEPDQINVPYWYVAPADLIAGYQAIKPLTSMPVMSNFQRAAWSTPADLQPYLGSSDVWMAEPYGADFSSVGHAVDLFNTLSRQPVWLAQDDIDVSLIVPKAYWAVIKGSTGILYFNWGAFKAQPAKLAAASQAFHELGQIRSAIFANDVSSQVTPPPGIGAIARSLNGSVYILAANPVGSPVTGQFSMPSLQAGTQITVLFENRTITAGQGGFSDSFSGADRHVYVIAGAPVPVTIATSVPGLALTVDGSPCTTPCSFQWPAASTHTFAVNPTTQTLTSGTQYLFSGWSDGGAAAHSIIVPAMPLTITASFKTQYYLSAAGNPAAGGTVSPGSGWYDAGATIPVAAVANYGYQFSGFGGSLSGAATPQNYLLNGPATITANFTQSAPRAGWYDSLSNRRKLTVDHTKVSGSSALANFPILVSFFDPELRSIANGGKVGKADGTDIVFTASDGTTKLNHELESFDAAAGKLVAWVQLPSVSPSSDTSLYVYYGNPAAADQQNKTNVWDSAYRIVNHFKDASASDSTQYVNNAVPAVGASLTQTGQPGPAFSLDGFTGALAVPYNASWNASFSSYTVEFWMKSGSVPDYTGALAIGGWGSAFNVWFYSSGAVSFRMDTGSGYCSVGSSMPLDNNFHHLAVSYDASASQLKAYVDGVAGSYVAPCSGNVALPGGDLTIGRFGGSQTGIQGAFDELRVSAGTPRSQDWIVTGFNSQKSPSTFFSVAASESYGTPDPSTTTVASNPPGLALNVDGSACTSPCSFQWTPGSNHTVALTSPQAGAAGVQYVFSNWSDGGALSHTVTATGGASTFTASFTTQYYLTTAAVPAAGGSIAPNSGWVNSGSAVAVSATAGSGYQFSGFSGALTSGSSPQNLTITGPVSVSASFTATGGGGGGGSATVSFLGTDTTTQGNWRSKYGSDGYSLAGDATQNPAYVTPSLVSSLYIWTTSTTDVRALQKASGTDRLAATWYSQPNFTIDLNFTDQKAHQVAIYVIDWDSYGPRAQTVELLDSNDKVLDTRNVSNFAAGQYLVWSISGHVKIRATALTTNAVIEGIFFGGASAPSSGAATFVGVDTTTQGNWKSKYGADGYSLAADATVNPPYVTPSLNSSLYVWTTSTTDVRALQKASGTDRLAAAWYSQPNFTIDLNFTDQNTHQVAIYAIDWDSYGPRAQTVELLDSNNNVLDTRNVSNFAAGQYLVWNVSGHVKIRATALTTNALIQGIFFGGASSSGAATFVGTDTATQGNWKFKYGADGYSLAGDATLNPAYVTPSLNPSLYIWTTSTTDVRALLKASGADRLAATWYSQPNFTIDLNLTDQKAHQVAIYVIDWDSYGPRAQTVELLDSNDKVLDTRNVSNFAAGQYLVWNISGHVKIRATALTTNAVIEGIFFGGPRISNGATNVLAVETVTRP